MRRRMHVYVLFCVFHCALMRVVEKERVVSWVLEGVVLVGRGGVVWSRPVGCWVVVLCSLCISVGVCVRVFLERVRVACAASCLLGCVEVLGL